MTKLYIDDERFPKGDGFVVVRSYTDALEYMTVMGCSKYISFDHDLGDDGTGFDVVKWIVERDLDSGGEFIPENFQYNVHSANPVGRANIEGYLKCYLRNR